ncbi:MAG: hypothetical protein ACR2NR_14115 [Solirubrobacteraceae bacterium]
MRARGPCGGRDQDTIEYAGVLAVIAAVIALMLGVVDDGLANTIKNGLRSDICRVLQSDCPAPGATRVHTQIIDRRHRIRGPRSATVTPCRCCRSRGRPRVAR